MQKIILESTLTCPECGYTKTETIPNQMLANGFMNGLIVISYYIQSLVIVVFFVRAASCPPVHLFNKAIKIVVLTDLNTFLSFNLQNQRFSLKNPANNASLSLRLQS
jgi:hypothetical protein